MTKQKSTMPITKQFGSILGSNMHDIVLNKDHQVKRLPPIRYINGQLEENFELEHIFKEMCNKDEQKFRNPLLHIDNIRTFLKYRYDDQLTEKILQGFGFNSVMRFSNYVEKLNKFLLTDMSAKIKFCFELYDQNSDEKICLVDLY
ncbi:UNKNOWN [Stylonychia lemnae]|uniref:EF-hand domain-containing protein n=1 Tax=Stylonychia lemnae TaxID=5949 RepID=A0A078A064_STYLE|nr:UNKNOWN [Stylonychia lemnae]|eukprot:CDW75272.1 UNKNOWN [Stylonychia lemnae]